MGIYNSSESRFLKYIFDMSYNLISSYHFFIDTTKVIILHTETNTKYISLMVIFVKNLKNWKTNKITN